MAEFVADRDGIRQAEARLDALFYPHMAAHGRFVRLEGSPGCLALQRTMKIDVVAAVNQTRSATVEEKIVHWPGYAYTAIAVETHSNLGRNGKSLLGDGWIGRSTADYLLYAFLQADEMTMLVWVFWFNKLREWVRPQLASFPLSDTDNYGQRGEFLYTTRSRIVALNAIPQECVLIRAQCV